MTQPLRFGIVLGQRQPWPELVRRTGIVAASGFDDFNLVDHFYGLADVLEPTFEAYAALGALAPYSGQMRLGIMVCGNTYRNPVLLLKQAITVDHISGGRLDFGVGTGWTHREHEAFSWEYPSAKVRVDMFSEALEIWTALQANERTNFAGQHYQLLDAPFEPKSPQGRLPVMIGGTGPRMLRLVVKHADIWNSVGDLEMATDANRRLTETCVELGRDPETIRRTVSPAPNFFESVAVFRELVSAYRSAGFSDIRLPWPRNEMQQEVFDQVVAEKVLDELRST